MHSQTDRNGITPQMLGGLFKGWPNPPGPDTFLHVLRGPSHVAVAMEDGQGWDSCMQSVTPC